ncbi:cytochrome o ubiquinol oxidase subunit I [Shigella flexneri]|nr:cytochrome o ubiquinol oxidase subunit I [Shigella flexneri]
MFGKLSLDAVPFHEPIVMVTIAGIILGGLALVGLITYFGKWTYLWKEWLTSVDHKRLGIMYIIVAIVMFGARDVAFPFLNNLSFWFTVVGVILVNVSLGVGEFAQTGWLAYPPLSGIEYSPGVGVDYWIWSLQLSGIGTTLTGINFFVTILKMRAPGMTMFKMPVFT